MGPASMFQVALVPPYREVDNAVKPIPKTRWPSKEMPQRSNRGHKSIGRKKIKR